MWERLSSRDKTVTALEQLLFVAGKPLPREFNVKLMTFGRGACSPKVNQSKVTLNGEL